MKFACSGIILAGGLSRRFNGREKAFIDIGGLRILDRIYEVFQDFFEEILLVTNHPLLYLEWDLMIVPDLYSIRSSLTGLHAGLFFMSNPYAFISACDTPFLKKEVVDIVTTGIGPDIDIVIPQTAAGLEPLCAAYSKNCIGPAERALADKKCKIQEIFKKRRIKKVSEAALRKKDPDLLSFFNVNTPADLKRAEKINAAVKKSMRPPTRN